MCLYMWSQHLYNFTSSPSLSMIVTVAAELGPTCAPLEIRSTGMDRSSWKDSIGSIKLSSVMSTVNSTLV